MRPVRKIRTRARETDSQNSLKSPGPPGQNVFVPEESPSPRAFTSDYEARPRAPVDQCKVLVLQNCRQNSNILMLVSIVISLQTSKQNMNT